MMVESRWALQGYGDMLFCCRNSDGVSMNLSIEYEREIDGRWLAEISELPGVLVYGSTVEEAMANAESLAWSVLAERMEAGA